MTDIPTQINVEMAKWNARLRNYVPEHRIEAFPRKSFDISNVNAVAGLSKRDAG